MILNEIGESRAGQIIVTIFVIVILAFNLWFSVWFVTSPILASIMLAFTPMFLYLSFFRPDITTLAFFAFSVFRIHEIMVFLSPYKLPYYLAFYGTIGLFAQIFFKNIAPFWTREMKFFLAFFIIVTVGVPFSYSFRPSFDHWKYSFSKIILIFFMFTWTIRTEKDFRRVIIVLVASSVFLSSIVFYNKIFGLELMDGSRATLGGESAISDPNDLALTLLFPLGFCCSLFIIKSNAFFIRLTGLLTSFMITLSILFTQSRGGMLGLFGVLGYFMSRQIKSKKMLMLAGTILVPLIYVASGITSRGEVLQEDTGRLNTWRAAFRMTLHNPVFGVGLNQFHENYPQYTLDRTEHEYLAVHSSWFQIMSETGFTGFFIFISCIYVIWKYSNIVAHKIEGMDRLQFPDKNTYLIAARGIHAGFIGFCISSTFLTQGFSWNFYVYSALIIALGHHIDKLRSSSGR